MIYNTEPDPVKSFLARVELYRKLIEAAEAQGLSRQEAVALLEVDMLQKIAEVLAIGKY